MSGGNSTKLLEPYLKIMVEKQASDLFFVTGAPPNMKVQGKPRRLPKMPLIQARCKSLPIVY